MDFLKVNEYFENILIDVLPNSTTVGKVKDLSRKWALDVSCEWDRDRAERSRAECSEEKENRE